MQDLDLISNSPEDTLKIGQKLATFLNNGDIVVLSGDLGAGKTKFVEGFLHQYNLQNEISSPTFNIVNEYNYKNINIYHFDVYRLEDSDEFYAIGGDEYFKNGICLIEWGEIIEDVLPNNYIHILFTKNQSNENQRKLTISLHGNHEKYTDIQNQFKEELI